MLNTESSPLSKSKILWAIFIIGIVLSILSAIIVYWFVRDSFTCQKISPSLCLMAFKDISFIPMAFLTATITAAGFWSLIFRSDQTHRQIQVVESNNLFNNYVSHKKEFVEFVKHFQEDNPQIEIVNVIRLYKLVFPQNSHKVFDVNGSESQIKSMNKSLSSLFGFLDVETDGKDKLSKRMSRAQVIEFLELGSSLEHTLEGFHWVISKGTFRPNIVGLISDEYPTNIGNSIIKVSRFIDELSAFANIELEMYPPIAQANKSCIFLLNYHRMTEKLESNSQVDFIDIRGVC